MSKFQHILINGLSIGSGGGYTVARELWVGLAAERPQWRFTLALVAGHPLHESLRGIQVPATCQILWAPPAAMGRLPRSRYEQRVLTQWAKDHSATALLQLNGMLIPAMDLPTLAHFQDPWPYRSEAWASPRDRVMAWLKRREHARTLRHAECAGWTSGYLRDQICGYLKIQPQRSEIFYNGIPQAWIDRASAGIPDWQGRQPMLLTVSNVEPYKRQDLVIRALPALIRQPGLNGLVYRIAGACSDEYRRELSALAASLGVGDRVFIEGRVSDQRVMELLAGARCFVLMSVCESFGIPAVEAMSFGTPVVTSDCCAMPEVCGSAAELVPIDDLEALTQRLARAMTDTARAEELSRLGAARVARFAWKATASRMVEVFDDLMTGRVPPAGTKREQERSKR